MKEDLRAKLASIPEVEPDDIDRAMLAQAEVDDDEPAIPLDEVKSVYDFSGKLNIRIPKSLHCQLSQEAKRDGVSLSRYLSQSHKQLTTGMRMAQMLM